jgi:catechol 2,3-dioxygenase-like lactoylglutathione lyase family enzyme
MVLMITKLNHVSVFVLDQESAYDFYINKLGFKVHTDASMGPGMRWLTVTPPDQPDLEISLMAISEGTMFKGDTAEKMRELVRSGTFGFGVFECNDLNATYEELKAKGVEFSKPPTKEFYGYEALFKDDSGNWFSLGQKEAA